MLAPELTGCSLVCFGLQYVVSVQFKAGSNECCISWHIDGTVYSQQHSNHKGRVLGTAEVNHPTCTSGMHIQHAHLLKVENHLKLDMISGFVDAKVYLQRHTLFISLEGSTQALSMSESLHEIAVSAQFRPLLSARGNRK